MAKKNVGNSGKNPYVGNSAGPHAAITKVSTKGPKATIHKGEGKDLRCK